MILWGFLAGRYALEVPLALAATLVFEQSYGGVDGDSASSAELYALLSALSDVPIKQSLAVTGSVNQQGEVQAIGGVNEKIEGFFDICRARGLNEEQGVLIPKSNVQHLMLREDVVEAVKNGQFAIYAVGTIDEGIEILTGVKAGERGPRRALPGRHHQPPGRGQAQDRLPSAAAASPSAGGRCQRGAERAVMIAHVAEIGRGPRPGGAAAEVGLPERDRAGGGSARRPRLRLRDREPVRGGRTAVRLRGLRLRARGLAVGPTSRRDVARRHDARPAPRRPGRAAPARGAGAQGRGAAALPRGARRAAARAVDRLRRIRARGTWWRWPSRSPAATAACSSSCCVEVSGSTGLVIAVGPKARRVTGPVVVAVEDTGAPARHAAHGRAPGRARRGRRSCCC